LEEALQNVKTLTGFLPMCAWCKNIRNKQYPELYTELKKKTEKEPLKN